MHMILSIHTNLRLIFAAFWPQCKFTILRTNHKSGSTLDTHIFCYYLQFDYFITVLHARHIRTFGIRMSMSSIPGVPQCSMCRLVEAPNNRHCALLERIATETPNAFNYHAVRYSIWVFFNYGKKFS